MTERKRIFVGGLFADVTKADLTQRFSSFGDVLGVDVKVRKDDNGMPIKTFAYVDVDCSEANLKKCFSTYNRNKWRGNELKLELAKESFLTKLQAERSDAVAEANAEVPVKVKEEPSAPPAHTVQIKGAVPGTPVPGERNWIVGRYGRVLPIVYLRRKDKRKVAKMDPSKFCHHVKRIKSDEKGNDLPLDNLTWQLDVKDTEILKRRMGNFPEFHPKPREKKRYQSENAAGVLTKSSLSFPEIVNAADNIRSDEFEVVPLTNKSLTLREKMLQLAGMGTEDENERGNQSDSSVATDEIIASSKTKTINKSGLNEGSFKKMKNSLTSLQSDSSETDNRNSKQKSASRRNVETSVSPDFEVKHRSLAVKTCSDSILEELLEGFQSSESSEDDASPRKKTKKPPPFRGTKILKGQDNNSEKVTEMDSRKTDISPRDRLANKSITERAMNTSMQSFSNKTSESKRSRGDNLIKEPTSSADSHEISVAKRKSSSTSVLILPSVKLTESCAVPRVDNSRQKSFLFDEFFSGLLPDGVTYAPTRTQESSTSETDDSEDYQAMELSDSSALRKRKSLRAEKSLSSKKIQSLDSDAHAVSDLNSFTTGSYREKETRNSKVNSNNSSDDISSDSESEDEESDVPKTRRVKTPDLSCIPSQASKSISLSLPHPVDDPSNANKDAYNSDSGESYIHKVPNQRRKSNLLSTSTPIPIMPSTFKGYNSVDSSLMLDEFSSGFLANARNLTSDESYSDSSSSASGSDSDDFESVIRTAEISSLKKSDYSGQHGDTGTSENLTAEQTDRKMQSSKKNIDVKSRSSSSSESISEDSIADTNDVAEEFSSAVSKSMTNSVSQHGSGKIPLKVDVGKVSSSKRGSEEKHTLDNQKRLDSLWQRQKETLAQKSAIQQALKSVDINSASNKKIVFSDNDDSDGEPETVVDTEPSTTSRGDGGKKKEASSKDLSKERARLFDSSSEDSEDGSSDDLSDSEMFNIKPQFEGKAGRKLMNLQARFGNDARFRLDEKFLASDDEEENIKIIQNDEDNEKSKTLKILRDVVGGKVPMENDANIQKRTFRSMLHYDPTKDEHKQFEVIQEKSKKPKLRDVDMDSSTKKTRSSGPGGEALAHPQIDPIPEVGKEKFYDVSSTLVEDFGHKDGQPPSTGFSLLAAFGKADTDPGLDSVQEERDGETYLRQSGKFHSWSKLEVFDSSDDDEHVKPDVEEKVKDIRNNSTDKPPAVASVDVFSERKDTFFFTKDDPRLKEGVDFFCRQEDLETVREKWLADRPRLIEAYRSKHKRVARRLKNTQAKRGQRPFQQK